MFEQLKAQVLGLDDSEIDPKELSGLIDALQGKLCRVVAAGAKRGDHLLTGQSPVSWVAQSCSMSKTSASDRLCVGAQLASLPQVEAALTEGQIGYQATSVICHLSEQLGEKREYIEEAEWIGNARRFSIKNLRYLAREARHIWDPEGSEIDAEEDFEQRSFEISETWRGMYRLDGWLDPVAGAELKTAIDALAKPSGANDTRTGTQRRADALSEMVHHGLEQGTMPRRKGVRPHLSVHTTIASLKGELGETVSHLENGMPISNKTVQRLSCDATLHRILKADSVVTDVGRAKRSVSPSQWRALKARYGNCAWPECDRPINWTNPHHIEFWARGGPSNVPNLVPLCHHHHRLVHEGAWQVIKAGDGIMFIPPDRVAIKLSLRNPGWAAASAQFQPPSYLFDGRSRGLDPAPAFPP